ncbi:MAG: Rieske 2Fe-2S domain-containing protein [Planctomycetia bacterium]|nr:Rieske 2Fe-2S domain-containing protein [Planctomycetia bacterium]MCC7313394.1 Rieske 2Fe-2S domain-containing protein [Planctomycetota bacterium]
MLPVADCRQGCARFVAVGDFELAVFRLSDPDRFVVTPNSCPHAGGNLAAGEVADGKVTCPWHHWEFDLASGHCTLSESVSLIRYETCIEDGVLYAKLPV